MKATIDAQEVFNQSFASNGIPPKLAGAVTYVEANRKFVPVSQRLEQIIQEAQRLLAISKEEESMVRAR